MDHTVFLAICFPLVFAGMVLANMWGMRASWGHRVKDPSNRRQAAHSMNDLVYPIRRLNRARTGFKDSCHGIQRGTFPRNTHFSPLAEVAYRHALMEMPVEQAHLSTQEREAAQQPFNLTS